MLEESDSEMLLAESRDVSGSADGNCRVPGIAQTERRITRKPAKPRYIAITGRMLVSLSYVKPAVDNQM